MNAVDVNRLARVDASYGALAATVLVVGIVRVAFGAKPADFYLENPVFWAKMASFAAVGLLSIKPTMRYLGWRRALPDGTPSDVDVAAARRFIGIQLLVFAAIPVFAALMARGIGG